MRTKLVQIFVLRRCIRKASEIYLHTSSYKYLQFHLQNNLLLTPVTLSHRLTSLTQILKMQNAVHNKDQWSISASSYAQGHQQLSNAPVETLFAQMDRVKPFSTATAILDVGCGPGVTLSRLIEKYGEQVPLDARLIALDFSAGMIEQVQKMQKEKQVQNPIWSRVEGKVGDAQVLDGIDDASISHITGTMVYNLVEDGRRALEAAYRVLRPEGVVGMTLGKSAEWMDMMAEAAHHVRRDSAPTYQFPKGYGTLDGIKSEFEIVGFSAEFVESMEISIDVSDPKPFVDTFIRGKNPGAMFFVGDYSEAELDAFVDFLLGLIGERCKGESKRLRGEAIVAVGKKLG
ncbi:methyltransferase family protein [Rutstroemia sp. NJR-2017a BVV2]|nr:methyltransferase family protein [Rutstroemia sp. NJR-2017a BVV2]